MSSFSLHRTSLKNEKRLYDQSSAEKVVSEKKENKTISCPDCLNYRLDKNLWLIRVKILINLGRINCRKLYSLCNKTTKTILKILSNLLNLQHSIISDKKITQSIRININDQTLTESELPRASIRLTNGVELPIFIFKSKVKVKKLLLLPISPKCGALQMHH